MSDEQAGTSTKPGSVLDQMMQPMKQVSEALNLAKERAKEQNEAVGGRLIDYAQSNLNDTLEALRAAAAAKDVQEVLTIQGKFLRDQMTRSMEQFRELGELIKPKGW
jgi:hypothetical protein